MFKSIRWVFLCTVIWGVGSGPLAFAKSKNVDPRPALVVLAEDHAPDADERAVLDRLMVTVVRNTTHGRYSSNAFLVDELANKFTFTQTIAQLVGAGKNVDVLVLVSGGEEGIALSRGALTAQELLRALRPAARSGKGGIRFVYSMSGPRMIEAWRELGARAVLAHSDSGAIPQSVPPFFFPHFMKHWGTGDSVTHSAAKAVAFSTRVAGLLGRYVPDQTLIAAGGVIATAPLFEGEDVNIVGHAESRPKELAPVRWPEQIPLRSPHEHTALREGLIEVLARLVSNRFSVDSAFVPGISDLIEDLGDPAWETIHAVFPGRGKNEISIPGGDVRVILSRVIPNFEKYMQEVVDHLENILVTRERGRTVVKVWLTHKNGLTLKFRDEGDAKRGQPYAMKLMQNMRFELFARRDSITIDNILGFIAMVKLPVVPDGIYPRRVHLDTSSEKLTISADAVRGVVHVVGTADVRAKKFTGVDWMATIFKNLPLIISILLFGIV